MWVDFLLSSETECRGSDALLWHLSSRSYAAITYFIIADRVTGVYYQPGVLWTFDKREVLTRAYC